MVFLHQVIHDMLGSAEFLNLCRDQKINLRQLRELLGTIPPDSEAMGNLIKAVMLHKHLQKQKLPRVSEVIDEVIDVSTSPSQSRSMSQPRPKSCAHAGRPIGPDERRRLASIERGVCPAEGCGALRAFSTGAGRRCGVWHC